MKTIGVLSRSCGVHSGEFHADEVTACALLLHFNLIDLDKIIRTRELGRLESCDFVCDVGGEYDPKRRRFDHHQLEYKGELSSAGMIWEYLRDQKIIYHWSHTSHLDNLNTCSKLYIGLERYIFANPIL